eukprot:TRINITY_DN2010_c0_g1_i1.p1 TRINITY_DN2010_c0_g1~~TRINITY_DN2010_c0_g1_i1.p1  ORF type:complete len:101 (+),score=21.96 TRINITY_DN2010_c0_g1_i1:38-304(+)
MRKQQTKPTNDEKEPKSYVNLTDDSELHPEVQGWQKWAWLAFSIILPNVLGTFSQCKFHPHSDLSTSTSSSTSSSPYMNHHSSPSLSF